MTNLMYHIVLALLRLMALLPLGVLYLFADVIYLILFHVVRYRRKVVEKNLAECFPDKSDAQRRAIEHKFYRNFADYIVETIKLLHISDAEMSRRMTFENIELIDTLTGEGKSVVVYFSHCGNWEWAPSITLHARHADNLKYCQVYRPLRSQVFDRLMLKVRSRFGSVSITKATVLRRLIRYKSDKVLTVTGFMSDQKQSHGDPTVVTTLFGRPTAFISGTETLARKLGFAAIYWDMYKVSRGRYRIVCRLLDDGTYSSPRGELTKDYARMLQTTILREPAIWLWTHKRWKYPVILPDNGNEK